MTRPMPGPPEKYQLLGPMAIVWEGGNGYYYHPSLMDAKRLTDAECAAHYWQADGECLALDNALIVGWSNHETVTNADTRAETWKRFMDTTHALEES